MHQSNTTSYSFNRVAMVCQSINQSIKLTDSCKKTVTEGHTDHFAAGVPY